MTGRREAPYCIFPSDVPSPSAPGISRRSASPPNLAQSAEGFLHHHFSPRFASGSTNCNSVSHGNSIQVSCDTSVTNVSTTSRAAGLA